MGKTKQISYLQTKPLPLHYDRHQMTMTNKQEQKKKGILRVDRLFIVSEHRSLAMLLTYIAASMLHDL